MPTWYDDLDYEEEEIVLKEYDITSTPNDFNILTIFSLIDKGVIKMPPFQRNFVWDIKKASKLIESIILGLPVPQVFLYEKGKNNFLVIDGQQRLLSIYFFIKQRFPTKNGRTILRDFVSGDITISNDIISDDKYFTNFSLKLPTPAKGEKNKLNKLKYETLGEYKNTFEFMRTIRSVVIKQNEPEDDSCMYEIFNRLNTGGQNLSSQEIRMSLYYSEFNKSIISLNKNLGWRRILKQETEDIHFKDVEILIRAFAMLFNYKNYGAPMTKFLNTFSKQASYFDQDTIGYLTNLFISFLESCSLLDKNAFTSKSGKFMISLFESVFVASCRHAFEARELLTRKINSSSIELLRSDKEFINATQGSVASKTSVTTRMNRAIEIIKFD